MQLCGQWSSTVNAVEQTATERQKHKKFCFTQNLLGVSRVLHLDKDSWHDNAMSSASADDAVTHDVVTIFYTPNTYVTRLTVAVAVYMCVNAFC